MATVKRFEELEVWKLSRELYKEMAGLIDSGVFGHNYKLIGQIESACGSIMDNIAEGFERGTRAEFIQFLGYAKGSSGELRSQLYKIFDRNLITEQNLRTLLSTTERISMMLQKFITYLQASSIEGVRKQNRRL